MRFHVADTLTGRVVGQLDPNGWELEDPLYKVGTGTLTVALPAASTAVDQLRELTLPRRRWIAAQDDAGRFLWAGPVVRPPGYAQGVITIPVADWRTWFYRAMIRPGLVTTYAKYTNTDMATIVRNLLRLGLLTTGAPKFTVDTLPATGALGSIEALQLGKTIGEYLDDLRADGGPDWYTYCTADTLRSDGSPASLLMHVAGVWPERRTRTSTPIIDWRLGKGGIAASADWPEGTEDSTRIWVVGDTEPPAQVWAVDEYPEIAQGLDVAWESKTTAEGTVSTQVVFGRGFRTIQLQHGVEGQVVYTIADERIRLGDLGTGDRVRAIFDNRWVNVDVPFARIVSRTMSGGRGKPTQQQITVDLADTRYGDSPGEEVDDG